MEQGTYFETSVGIRVGICESLYWMESIFPVKYMKLTTKIEELRQRSRS